MIALPTRRALLAAAASRLRENGKPQKVAHIAAARKIIVILNAMLRSRNAPVSA